MVVEMHADYVTAHEIAARMNQPPHRVRNWVARGKLPEPAFRIPPKNGRPHWVWNRELKRIVQHLIDTQRVS